MAAQHKVSEAKTMGSIPSIWALLFGYESSNRHELTRYGLKGLPIILDSQDQIRPVLEKESRKTPTMKAEMPRKQGEMGEHPHRLQRKRSNLCLRKRMITWGCLTSHY